MLVTKLLFRHLIKKYSFKDITDRFVELYTEQVDSLEGYEHTYNSLLKKKKYKRTDMEICINFVIDQHDVERGGYWDVCGKDLNQINKKGNRWALDFCNHSEWLNFEISKKLLLNMKEVDIICHCLWEMTFMGFDEKDIRKEKRKLDKLCKEAKDSTLVTRDWDNFWNDLID